VRFSQIRLKKEQGEGKEEEGEGEAHLYTIIKV
jgi:hypothetical protein